MRLHWLNLAIHVRRPLTTLGMLLLRHAATPPPPRNLRTGSIQKTSIRKRSPLFLYRQVTSHRFMFQIKKTKMRTLRNYNRKQIIPAIEMDILAAICHCNCLHWIQLFSLWNQSQINSQYLRGSMSIRNYIRSKHRDHSRLDHFGSSHVTLDKKGSEFFQW